MLQMLLVLTTTLAHFVVKLLWPLYPDRDRGQEKKNPKANFPKRDVLVSGRLTGYDSDGRLFFARACLPCIR